MKKIYLLLLSVVLMLSTSAVAQNFRTGYFLDGYMYKYQLNPAFQGERGFIALPVLGGVSFGVETNMALNNFIYPAADGTLQTFLHPDISADAFMGRIKDVNAINENLDLTLLALGFRAKKTYHTIDISLKESVSTSIPGDIFRFMKSGGSNNDPVYDLSTLSTNLNSYLQAAYGFSFKIKDVASIGIRAKFLLGVASLQSNITDLRLSMNQDKWTVNAGGEIIASSMMSGMLNSQNGEIDLTASLMDLAKTPSMGAAFDFGVSVDFLKHFTFSASVLDLGFIHWKNASKFVYGPASWEYDGFENISINGAGDQLEDTINEKLDELVGIFEFKDPEQIAKHTQMLGFTSLMGLEFRLPFYTRISLGALGTHRFEGDRSWTEGRFSLNYAPFRWLSLSGNYAISTFGESYGAALNLHPKGFNLFLGVDSFKPLLNLTPQLIPIDEINTNLKVGLTFPFGKYNGRYPKKDKVGKE
jgi:hypothetical protein